MRNLMARLLTRRALARTALVTLAAGAIVAGLGGTANAAVSGHVTGAQNVVVQSAPKVSSVNVDTAAAGSTVSIKCRTSGQEMSGTYGTSKTWYLVGKGGFVPAAKVKAASTPGACPYAGSPPRANPRSMDNAISAAFGKRGSTGYENLCLRFTALMYGWSYSGWNTAEIGGDYMVSHGRMKSGVPPRGALVWYHNSAGTGHVAISIGDGKVIGTSVNGRVGVAGYKAHASYRGWSTPYYPAAG
ncbi:hypothetical protein AB0I28_10065 [Phytomonospora sp. NPDC050363]|uniref:hypothetical protein n=1 Tax=Phytomonospora sp. NPDC050363 TaxID=3155642 RepID=UPI0033F1E756